MEDFFIYLLKSSGLLTVFFLCYHLLLKKDTSFITNRVFLLGGLVTSAVLPGIYFTKTLIIKAKPTQFQFTENTFPVTEVVIQDPMVSPLEVIAGIYLLGVMVMITRLLLQLHSLSRVLLSGKISRKENANFIKTTRQIAPFSFLNYIVYNPALHAEKELQYILKHEKAHVKQKHTIDVLLAHLNLIYQWFNPFAWIYLKTIQQNLEFIADREAVTKAICKKEYQKTLVKISVENSNLALANNFYQSLIKKRIVMLNKSSSNKYTTWKTVLIAPALLAFVFLFNIKTVAQVQEEEERNITSELNTNLGITFQIINTSKEEQLNTYSRLMKKYKVDLEFENIQRNEAGLITAITAKFLDRNNNSTGSISRQNKDGIKGFVFNYNENEGSGFKSIDPSRRDHNLLGDLGESPLIIIAGKQYTTLQLAGKSVNITGDVSSVSPKDAAKKYGDIAKDGALIISEGKVIDDFKREMKEIDNQDIDAIKRYIQFEKGESPMFISVNKNFSGDTTKSGSRGNGKSGSGSVGTTRNFNNLGDPVYVVNGKLARNKAIIDTINPESITGINVLKGYSATKLYGKDAKDGAIIITTKKHGDTTKLKKFTLNPARTGTLDSLTLNRTYLVNRVEFFEDGISGKTRAFNAGDKIFYPQLTGNVDKRSFIRIDGESGHTDKPLIIVDGKEMPAEFEMGKIDNNRIEFISVIKGKGAIEKYGEDAKGGAVEITTKSSAINQAPLAFVATLKASTTGEGLRITKEQLLTQAGIEVNFKKIKRNKDGLITSIQVSAKHKGENVTLSVSESSGISDVYISKVNDKIKVTTIP